MEKKCKDCDKSFELSSEDLQFIADLSPRIANKTFELPTPEKCPECRRRQRLAHRNEQVLYRRTGDLTGRPMLSMYSPDKPFKVYYHEEWWSDACQPELCAQEVDTNSSVFTQLQSLQKEVPVGSLLIVNGENSEYNNNLYNSRNCYLVFGSKHCFDCMYVTGASQLNDCLEVWGSNECDQSYHIFRCSKLFGAFFCERCSSGSDILFSKLCLDCSSCYGSYVLKHAKHRIFNEAVSPKAYKDFISAIDLGSYDELTRRKAETIAFFTSNPLNPTSGEFTENCGIGDLMYLCNDCHRCFTTHSCEHLRDCYECKNCLTSSDLDLCEECSGHSYQVVSSSYFFKLYFSYNCHNCSDSYYLSDCFECHHCFGCIGLYSRDHCIFNKQYTKKEYEELVPKIVKRMQEEGSWGEFFPYELSRFGYNETDANFHYPMTREEALEKGYKWCDYVPPELEVKDVIHAKNVPDHIDDVPEEILDIAIACERTGKYFRIQTQELAFYRTKRLALPRLHPGERGSDIARLRPPLAFREEVCTCKEEAHGHSDVCSAKFLTTIPEDWNQLIHCTPCFMKWVYYD